MRRNLSIILVAAIVIAVLIGLSAVRFIKLDRDAENEANPQRSTYNPGPTGTRALYQLLEESGAPVARWRRGFSALEARDPALLVIVGPVSSLPSALERSALERWVVRGGHLLIISRDPTREFRDPGLHVIFNASDEDFNKPADEIADLLSDRLIVQPTTLTRGLKGLQVSTLSTRIRINVAAPAASPTREPSAPPPTSKSLEEETDRLSAPVVHLGDREGAVLADFDYGDGRIVLLSDPFIVANNGIARGTNLTLALNLVNELAGRERRVLFDEAHHGFRDTENQLLSYFRGTAAPWVLGQGLLLAILTAYTYGRRFARPLPISHVDRHSPLEFVGSMANLQKLASARDLAIENIYPRFRADLCRTLGVSTRASAAEIASLLARRELKRPGTRNVAAGELTRLLRDCEGALGGVPLDDHEMVTLVAGMRRIKQGLTSSNTTGRRDAGIREDKDAGAPGSREAN